ncbi:MAG: M28 family peptidase [Acidobacteria bacterium]|nr:M28 family peptidase [Acidobacteriota bacterium]
MHSRVNLIAVILLANVTFAAAGAGDSPAARGVPQSQIDTFKRYVEYLADDEREGRGLGTKGIGQAAEMIETRLKDAGLAPAFGTSFRQPFRVKTGVESEAGNVLEGIDAESWTALGFSSSGRFSGEIAFVGYGIDAEPIGYRELEGVDLKGKVALILRYEPQERDDASPFDGKRPSRWSAIRYKVLQARERGAVAVIFATGPLQDEGKDKLPALRNDGPESPAGLPVIQVRTSVAEKWLASAGIDLKAWQLSVDRDLRPRSQAKTGLILSGNVALKNTWVDTENVAGIVRGKGKLAKEYVVIGAHYDHLGMGGDRSVKPNETGIHNGADDNASGTAAALIAADRLQQLLEKSKNHRSVIVALFSAEEVGLAGSGHFVESSPVPASSIVAMINLDMVGNLTNDELAALGADSAPEWKPAVEAAAKELNLKPSAGGDGYGPSDQTSFYAVGIPVIHFFTGTHDRYHSPADDSAAINFEGGARVAELTARLGATIAGGDVTPRYAKVGVAPAMQGDSRGYGAYLGTVPDNKAMGAASGGVLLSDVRKGGPADLAGIRGGDTIVKIAGTTIANLYDMTYALQDSKPGETVDVVVVREGKELTLRATLGERAARGGAPPPQAAKPAPGASPPPITAQPSPDHAPPAPTATPSRSAPPVARHAGMPPASMSGAPAVLDFYANRPGENFVVGAGKPFEKQFEGETHLKDIRQLTFVGENAEAYFSPDGKSLIWQSTPDAGGCDQQYIMDLGSGATKLVSGGKGRTTCGYYDWPEADRLIWASTISGGDACPTRPDRSRGYVWPVFGTFELYTSDLDGSNVQRLTNNDAYDAEATWCHRGGKFVFTSDRHGDLDLYEMDEAGNVRQLTNTPGYDGGAFYSADCREIVWRAWHYTEGDSELADYRALLKDHLVRPSKMELWVMNADGTNQRQVTETGAANFGPYFHADGKRIIYSSNHNTGSNREFELYMIDKNGGEPERITTAPGFDGFPMFSPDGRWIVWGSNRASERGFDTNLFIARWIE